MRPNSGEQRHGWALGKGWSLLLSPLLISSLLIGGALSIPYSAVRRRLLRRRSRAFEQQMKAAGRLIPLSDFIRQIEQGRGTLIVERSSFKGPVDIWWTADNTYQLCPYPAVDWLTMLQDKEFQPVSRWYKEHYTSAQTGRALLVAARHDGDNGVDFGLKLLNTGLDAGNWVEIPPAEKFERRKPSASRQ